MMKGNKHMKTITNLICPAMAVFALACFALLPAVQAVSPAPDGGYPGGNTAEGQTALLSLTTGGFNTAVGYLSLRSNTTNSFNTAIGAGTLLANTADQNTATGAGALLSNTTGTRNTANGAFALFNNRIGNNNTAIGNTALEFNTGTNNTAIGFEALANSQSDANVALGSEAGVNVFTASGVICIGAFMGGADVSNTTWIENVYGVTTQNSTTAPVIVSADGQLGTVASSERFKKDIATMDKASEVILSLRPVSFHYKNDAKNTPQFGLIAEEVANVDPALVLPDKEGKPYSVRYEAVNAMLLNEFLKEHRKVEEQERTIAQLKSTIAQQMEAVTARLKEHDAQFQKVSAQLELSKPAPRTVGNNQ
jgi:hypothetical protein